MRNTLLLLFMLGFSNIISSQCTTGNCEDGYGEQNYSGGKYQGYFSNGKRSGKGTYTWTSGAKYEGEWKDGQYHGYGISKSDSGSCYEGEFRYDKRHGLGTQYTANGDVTFAGQYIEGEKQVINSALSTDVLADKYLLEAKKLMDAGSYKEAIVSFNRIQALKVSPPVTFYYFLGKCFYKSSSYTRAIIALTKYLNTSGKNAEYYSVALEMLSDAESKSSTTAQSFSEKKMEIKNCSLCSGSGYYYKKVTCGSCRGRKQFYGNCSDCAGSGRSSTRCGYCGGTGSVSTHVGNGIYSSQGCSYCNASGWMQCYKCTGNGGYYYACSACNGYGTSSEKTKCYKH